MLVLLSQHQLCITCCKHYRADDQEKQYKFNFLCRGHVTTDVITDATTDLKFYLAPRVYIQGEGGKKFLNISHWNEVVVNIHSVSKTLFSLYFLLDTFVTGIYIYQQKEYPTFLKKLQKLCNLRTSNASFSLQSVLFDTVEYLFLPFLPTKRTSCFRKQNKDSSKY